MRTTSSNNRSRILIVCMFLGFSMTSFAQANVDQALEQQALVDAIRAENWSGTLAKTAALRKRGIDLGTEILFFEGRANEELGNRQAAESKLTEYVNKAGARGANYSAALTMLGGIRQGKEQERQAAKARQQEIEARKQAELAVEKWLATSVVGQVTSVDNEWQFFKVRFDDASASGRDLQVVDSATKKVGRIGALKDAGDGEYSTTADFLPAPGSKIHLCCKP